MRGNITLQMADGTEKTFAFQANAGTRIHFRQVFKKELLESITGLFKTTGADGMAKLMKATRDAEEAGLDEISLDGADPETLQIVLAVAGSGEFDTISKLAYIMNKSAEGEKMSSLDVEGYLDWLEQFETLEFLTHAMDFISLYMNNTSTTSTMKKKVGRPSEG